MIQEDFIAQKGLNSIFSELENFELVQNPNEEGFLSSTVTLKKREGLFTDQGQGGEYNRETDGDILGKIIIGGLAFFRDDECKIYRFEKPSTSYTMTKIYDNDDTLSVKSVDLYGNRIKQKAITVPYLDKFVVGRTADSVLSTNDDGNGNVVLSVNETGVFSSDSVGQYIYFTNSSSSKVKYQIRQIVQFIDDQNVYLDQQFYSETSTREANEPGETYETIDQIVVFNNLRDANNLVLCVGVNSGEISFRNLGGNDIEIFEGRFWYINSYGTSVAGSFATGEYEIIDPTTVLGSSLNARGQKMNSLYLTQTYLLVNQETSISVVWQIATSDETSVVYNLNSIIGGDAAISPESLCTRGGLYYVSKDGTLQGGNITAVSSNIIYCEPKNQGIIIQKYLNEIIYNTYVNLYNYGRGMILQYINNGITTMLVYDSIYECWMPRIFSMEIYDKFELFYGDMLIGVGNKICIKGGNSDLGEDIKVKYVVTGSKNFINSLFSLKKIKLSLGYYGNIVNFKIRLDLGYAVFEGKIEKDAKGIDYLTRQNMAGGTSFGSIPMGLSTLGGQNQLSNGIAKIGLIGIPIGSKCGYYKLTLENVDNYDLNIVGLSVLLEGGNTFITPYNNVF